MNRHVIFKTLWLVSEIEQKAKKQTFDSRKNILYGPNGTGKSRITKNLFWTLGCSPQKHIDGGWNPDVIGALDFEYLGQNFRVIRQNKLLGLFDGSGNLLKFADNMRTWDRVIAQLFGYRLKLQRPSNTVQSQAGIDYLTLPFYIDQDGSWGANWDTYTTLGQFSKWAKPVFESFIGLRPNAYFEAYQRWQSVQAELTKKQSEMEVQRVAFLRVREFLPKNVPALTEDKFETELNTLAQKTIDLQRKQSELRAKVVVALNLKEKLTSELQLMAAAYKNLTDDLGFLSEFDDKGVECPTCGTVHTNSFHARLQLTQDTQSISILIDELKKEREKVTKQYATLTHQLSEINTQIRELDEAMKEEHVYKRSKDMLLAAHSVKTLDAAFTSVTSELSMEVQRFSNEEDALWVFHGIVTDDFTVS
ncbi:hypothetical protein [Zwartia sp.]|uniref:hypothetical protein n=1 Tax=Zwartia sp. TaxID=2978004 RepID=UPI0027181664|nr:hypothetical protein [Zwartia sp.]MDO9025827.1 hypothetical protein [Zwartia sp.]